MSKNNSDAASLDMQSVPNNRTRSRTEYEVGYKRPPKKAQFKKGMSGNSRGRPKKTPAARDAFKKVFRTPVDVSSNGRTLRMRSDEAAFWKLRRLMLEGNLRAFHLYFGFCQQFKLFSESNELNPQLQALVDALNHGPVEEGRKP